MNDLDQLLRQIRARAVLQDINDGVDKNMPCGDQRVAALLVRFNAIKLTNPKRSRFTSGFTITDLGRSKL